MAPRSRIHHRLAALALACGLLAAVALPAAAAAPPAAAGPPVDGATASSGGLASLIADWLVRLIGEPEPPPPDDGDVLGTRIGPAGPLIDPNGNTPKDPRPRDGNGTRR